ncbi:hypothetical protein JQ543_13705 [Bradyrhizobium diazoefficiens]|nr:hypothetical protein [Bradyrhizobium diazoefficiens]MBR0848803.1 hypothetical protein [Bradyrhizobium diazoefficiens]
MLTETNTYSHEQLVEVISEQMTEPYTRADNLRTAVMYCPLVMTASEFVRACETLGIHPGSARNRYNEVRKWQREIGEI